VLFTTFYAQAVFGHALGQVLALVSANQTSQEPVPSTPAAAPQAEPEEPAAAQKHEE
jgi:hypothetical protein